MLRKITAILLLFCLLFSRALAQERELPQKVTQDLTDSGLFKQGCEVVDHYFPDEHCCVVLLRSPWNNLTLYCYEQQSSAWLRRWDNTLMTIEATYRIVPEGEGFKLQGEPDGYEHFFRFEPSGGAWYVTEVFNSRTGMRARLYNQNGQDAVFYSNRSSGGSEALVDFTGAPRTAENFQEFTMFFMDADYLNRRFAAIPAYSMEGFWHNTYVSMWESLTFPVYSGPGRQYIRAANGRALVGCMEPFSVLGRSDNWLMVFYSISDTQNRVGFIDSNEHWMLRRIAECVDELSFQPAETTLARSTDLHDDPINAGKAVAELSRGSSVQVLAQDDAWCYVEVSIDGRPTRGFISPSAVQP